MKLTVITDKSGQILGTVQGHSPEFTTGDFKAGILISEGETHHEIEVPDEFSKLGALELHNNLESRLKKSK